MFSIGAGEKDPLYSETGLQDDDDENNLAKWSSDPKICLGTNVKVSGSLGLWDAIKRGSDMLNVFEGKKESALHSMIWQRIGTAVGIHAVGTESETVRL